MIKYFFISVILLCSSMGSLFAQSGWFPLANAPKSINLNNIYFINADTGFVNGTDQGAMRTTDGGDTWKPMGINGGKYKFYFNNKFGISVSYPILTTTNYGRTWTQRFDISANDIDFPTEKIGYAITGSADTTRLSLGKSTDGGNTWTYRDILPRSPGKTKVVGSRCLSFRDEMHGYLTETVEALDGSGGGYGGYYTTDGGVTWSETTSSDEILYLSDSTWLLGVSGAIMKTVNNFTSLQQVSLSKIPLDAPCNPGGHLCKTNDSIVASLDIGSGAIFSFY